MRAGTWGFLRQASVLNRLKVREKLVAEKLWTYEQSLQHVPLTSSPLALRWVLCESLSGDCGLPRPLTGPGQVPVMVSTTPSCPKGTRLQNPRALQTGV